MAVTAALLGAGWAATMGTSCGGSGSAPACFDDGAGSCRAWRDCQPGSYVGEEGTATTDRVCAICPAGTVSTTLNAVGCTSWDRCVPGEQVGTGAAGDRRCQACPSGSFSTTFDAASCTAWQSCAPGTFVADPSSSREDRECKPCAAGTYSSGVDRSACLPEDVCPAGTVRRGGGCEPCPAGQHCAGGDAPGVECTEGSWDDDGDPATACVPQTSCSPGFLVAGDGSATEDRSCASCAGGSYSATMNAGTCLPWSSCQAGRHVAAAGTNVTDRACEDCAPGTFSASADAPACAPWTPCAPGSYVTTAGTSTADQACSACTGGLVCDGACLVGAACCTAAQCEDGDACTTDSCDAASHQCGHAAAGDGARPTASSVCCGGRELAGTCCVAADCAPSSGCAGTPTACAALPADQRCPSQTGCWIEASCRTYNDWNNCVVWVQTCTGTPGETCSAQTVPECTEVVGCSVQENSCTDHRCAF